MSTTHWHEIYATRGVDEVSWYQRDPTVSVRPVESGAAEFAPGFVLESEEREEHVTPAGVLQPFTWAVLRRV